MASAADPSPQPVSIDTQHNDMIHDVQLDYYGCKLATASSDRTVKIFDVSSGTYAHTATLQGHEGPVWEVSWAHPAYGVLLASCSFDGTVAVHREIRQGEWNCIHTHRTHESSVNSVAFAPRGHGLALAAAGSDGRVSVLTHGANGSWTAAGFTGDALGVNSVGWAPHVGGEYRPRLVTGGCDNRVRFWTCADGTWVEDEEATPRGAAQGHTDWVRDVAWAPGPPDADVVASCGEDGTVLIWTREGGGAFSSELLHRVDGPVWRLSWSVTGNVLAVSSGDSNMTLWKQDAEGGWGQVDTVEDVPSAAGGQQMEGHVGVSGTGVANQY